jgi:outer membrane protein
MADAESGSILDDVGRCGYPLLMSTRSLSVLARISARALVIALLAICLTPTLAAAQSKIAVIDMRRAVFDTEDGLRVQAKLQQLFDSRQTEFESKEKAYASAKTELEQLSKDGKTGDKELRRKYATLEKKAYELQSAQQTYRRDMQRQETEQINPIIKQMMVLVRRLAAQSGYDMVLNKDAVPYARSDLNITDRVIQMYNANQSSTSPGSKPKGKGKSKRPAKSKPKSKVSKPRRK